MIPPKGKTDFMIDTDTMKAHFWAEFLQDMTIMLMMQQHDLKIGGFSIEYTVSDTKPDIFN
jgi:hypothetical protein